MHRLVHQSGTLHESGQNKWACQGILIRVPRDSSDMENPSGIRSSLSSKAPLFQPALKHPSGYPQVLSRHRLIPMIFF